MARPFTRQSLAIGMFAEVSHKGGRGGRFVAEIVAHVPQSRLVVGRNLDTGRTLRFSPVRVYAVTSNRLAALRVSEQLRAERIERNARRRSRFTDGPDVPA